MNRRAFITTLGGAAAWPLAASAQAKMPVVGFLSSVSPDGFTGLVAAFGRGLKEVGYIDEQNVTIEYRWAQGRYDRLPELASDLVQRKVAVIVATGSPNSAQVAKVATATIPIVFANGGDPVADGLVGSLNRPVGNITGVTFFTNVLTAKRLELLRELMPRAAPIAVLVNPSNARAAIDTRDVEEAARVIGQQIIVLNASNEGEIDSAFATAVQMQAGAFLVNADGFLRTRTERLVTLAARHSLPAMYSDRDWTLAGGLMSYGASIVDSYRQAGVYAGQILKGAKPADLPVLQPTRFALVLNLKTAKALGLTVPDKLLALADEVIE